MASEAQIRANQVNAQRSSGPKTLAGKEQSRRNALKHGLTGAGVVIPEADAAEVERRSAAFVKELEAIGEVEIALARRAALNSVRMERGADQQTAMLTERLRLVDAQFVAPEGATELEGAKLRDEACRRAMFDPSQEATLARKYEAAAERGFHRALKELRQIQKSYGVPQPDAKAEVFRQELGSILAQSHEVDEFDAMYARALLEDPSLGDLFPNLAASMTPPAHVQPASGVFEVPFAIGKPR